MDSSDEMRVLLAFGSYYLQKHTLAAKKKEEEKVSTVTIGKFHRIFRFPWRTDVITDDGRDTDIMQKVINKFVARKRKLDKPTLGNSNTKKQRLHDTPGL
jgi:hypothetical protein